MPRHWLWGMGDTTTVRVPVFVPDTIEPPNTLDRYLVRSRFGYRATTRPAVRRDVEGVVGYGWAIVAAVGDEPILRVSLP